MLFPFQTSFAQLPASLHLRTLPTPVAAPSLIALNGPLAAELGLDAGALGSKQGVAALAGNAELPEAAYLACAYAGHQFGNFVPRLGDGRAILLGEVMAPAGGRMDVQLKGAGPTPFSRNGDGRAALGPVLREYIVSEAMAALGIPTTRALACLRTGEEVWRETPLPGAILVRVAASHIRVGSFQFAAAHDDREALQALTDHVIARHYPHCAQARNPAQSLLAEVSAAQGRLVAAWLLVGFIHGVMNTDNCAISGQTIDYGPCAFMDGYNPGQVFSSIDRGGRYAYARQPHIAQWNLARLAECLLPLMAEVPETAVEMAQEALGQFADAFKPAYFGGLIRKIGLEGDAPEDLELAQQFLELLAAVEADFTISFRALGGALAATPEALAGIGGMEAWLARWRTRLGAEADQASIQARLDRTNPAYIPRNHLIEAAIQAALSGDDAPFHQLIAVLAAPFAERPEWRAFALGPNAENRVLRTFCGT